MSAVPARTAEERAATPCYIGRRDCGCLVAAAVDVREHRKDTAKFVSGLIRDGLTVERMTVAEVRAAKFGCDHEPPKAAKPPRRQGSLI